MADMGIQLAGWDGENEPEIDDEYIRFNGHRHCGHSDNEEVRWIPYPADNARGLGPSATAIIGPWYWLGVKLGHRCCGGNCSHETFSFPKIAESWSAISDEPETRGLCLSWTKTAFKPYDISVTAALLIAKRYLRHHLVVHSNGLDPQWADAKELCQRHLGYGDWLGIIEDPRVEMRPGPNGSQIEHEVRLRILVELDPSGFH